MCLKIQLHQSSPEFFIIEVLSTSQASELVSPIGLMLLVQGQRESSMADVPVPAKDVCLEREKWSTDRQRGRMRM